MQIKLVVGGGGNGIHGPDSDFLSFSGAKIVPKLNANFKFSYGSKKHNWWESKDYFRSWGTPI